LRLFSKLYKVGYFIVEIDVPATQVHRWRCANVKSVREFVSWMEKVPRARRKIERGGGEHGFAGAD
jgi:hypothetical protein